MAGPYILTYYDVWMHLVDFIGKDGSTPAQRDVARAVQSAHAEVANAHHWDYYDATYRVRFNAPYSTGTVVYDHTGGTYERELTLTTGTWPDWIEDGKIRIGSVNHVVESKKSSTVITLDPTINPGADVASTTYTAFCTDYALPNDFISLSRVISESNWWNNTYVTPEQFVRLENHAYSTGDTLAWTIKGDPSNYSQLVLSVYPGPASATSADLAYRRRPRPLRITGNKTGHTVGTVTIASGAAAVTGNSTTFASDMVGSIIRLGDTSNVPTGLDGLNPFVDERSLVAFATAAGAAAVTLDSNVSQTFTAVKYMVTDAVDIDQAIVPLFLRCCEKQMAILRRMEDMANITGIYEQELRKAMSATNRHTELRFAGDHDRFESRRMAHYTKGADVV